MSEVEEKIKVMDIMHVLMEPFNIKDCSKQAVDRQVYMATDVGSTMQRSMSFSLNGKLQSTVIEYDTRYCPIDMNTDFTVTTSASPSIQDNLDLTIRCNNPNQMTKIKGIRIVKGSLQKIMNLPERVLTADTSKVDSEGTYVNVLSSIAVMLLGRCIFNNETVTDKYLVDATISLPPDDASSTDRVNTFKECLQGDYTVTFNRLGVSINFDINQILVASEPVGAAYSIMYNDKLDEDGTYAFVECGGRSSGVVFYERGNLKQGSSYSFPIGGFMLIDKVSEEIVSSRHLQKPRSDVLLKTLATGLYRYGADLMDVSKELDRAKNSFAEELYNGISAALALNKIPATDIITVYCTGRTFGEARRSNEEQDLVVSRSVGEFLHERFVEKSPKTQFIFNQNSHLVVRGLVLYRITWEYLHQMSARPV